MKQNLDNIEIILIDDGSTDNSGKICDEYAKEYFDEDYERKDGKNLNVNKKQIVNNSLKTGIS